MQLHGNFLDLFIVFGAGVMVSFTPCVYPVIPLTAGCIGRANLSGTKAHGFFLSLIFVLGLSLTYCGLAVIASLTGRAFGMIQNQPFVYAVIAVFLCLFGFIMLDIFSFPQFHFRHADRVPRNAWTVFLFGVVSGLAVGPCVAPVLGTLLVYVASRERLLEGVVLMLVFSYGVGFSLILVGTFSGLLSAMPKSGSWMLWVKRISGMIILIAAGFFLFKALGLL
jgi:thiol:disulfide interchange protein DsbD